MMFISFVILLVCFPEYVAGHAYLSVPASRNALRLSDAKYCPHCGQSQGFRIVSDRIAAAHGSIFPDVGPSEGTHGLCGDPFQTVPVPSPDYIPPISQQTFMKDGEITEIYTQGQIVEFTVVLNSEKRGYFEFRICEEGLTWNTPSQVEGQKCLEKHVLKRVDPATRPECAGAKMGSDPKTTDCQPLDKNFPSRWYLPPNTLGQENKLNGIGPKFTMKYHLPEDLSCVKCTLQFYWLTANSCNPEGYVDYYLNTMGKLHPEIKGTSWDYNGGPLRPCSPQAQTEQFWNCADISIKPSTSGSGPYPPKAPSKAPSSEPPSLPEYTTTQIPTTDAPTTSYEPATQTTPEPTYPTSKSSSAPSTQPATDYSSPKQDSSTPSLPNEPHQQCQSSQQIEVFGYCKESPACCGGADLVCFKKNEWYAQCLPEGACKDGKSSFDPSGDAWTCDRLGVGHGSRILLI